MNFNSLLFYGVSDRRHIRNDCLRMSKVIGIWAMRARMTGTNNNECCEYPTGDFLDLGLIGCANKEESGQPFLTVYTSRFALCVEMRECDKNCLCKQSCDQSAQDADNCVFRGLATRPTADAGASDRKAFLSFPFFAHCVRNVPKRTRFCDLSDFAHYIHRFV